MTHPFTDTDVEARKLVHDDLSSSIRTKMIELNRRVGLKRGDTIYTVAFPTGGGKHMVRFLIWRNDLVDCTGAIADFMNKTMTPDGLEVGPNMTTTAIVDSIGRGLFGGAMTERGKKFLHSRSVTSVRA